MAQDTQRSPHVLRCRATAALITGSLLLGTIGLGGCGVVSAIRKVEHAVTGNKATIDTFTNSLQSSEATTFEVTYTTTGSSPATIVYAVEPPKDLAFEDTPSTGSAGLEVVVNASGEYACTPPGGSRTTWSCNKLSATDAANQNTVFDIYTPAHWVTFLRDFALAAGFAGDKVTS